MPDDYISKKVERSVDDGFQRSMNIFWKGIQVFKILMTNDLQRQKVYMLRWTKWIHKEGSDLFINKIKFETEKNNTHPFTIFGKCFGRSDMCPGPIIYELFEGSFKRRNRTLVVSMGTFTLPCF